METADFEKKFGISGLAQVLAGAKTLSKKECEAIYEYFKSKRPKRMLEFGVQFGCSTRAYLEIAGWLGLNLILDSWDIVDQLKFADKTKFNFHLEDVTGRENAIMDQYKPDVVFIDLPGYAINYNLTRACMECRIDMIFHSTSYYSLARGYYETDRFQDLRDTKNGQWPIYLMGTMIDKSLWLHDRFENNDLIAECIRDLYGIGIVKYKPRQNEKIKT